VLHGDNPIALRAAGEEALDEIERLESQLSLYRPGSEIARLNASAAKQPVKVSPTLFALLQQAKKLSEQTGGAFDITIAPLVRAWGFMTGDGHLPEPAALTEARARVGMHLIRLNAEDFTVRFDREGVMLDLGAIGKGYAIERAAELLREAGVSSALLHGGTSTVYAIGQLPDGSAWKVAVGKPHKRAAVEATSKGLIGGTDRGVAPLAVVPLKDEALSVSALSEKCFQAEGKTFGHVLDSRTGNPVHGPVLAAVVLPSATETDALSTALLVLGTEGHQKIANLHPDMRTLLMIESEGGSRVESKNMVVEHSSSFGPEERH